MNQNDFDVPPVIDVPADVRARIEARVLPHLSDEERSPRTRLWLMTAAAAVVIALGGGVAAVTLQSQPHESGPAATGQLPDLDAARAATEMGRCWQAAQELAPVATYPDRASWQHVMSVAGPSSTITAMQAGGKPLFCETTERGVTLSSPAAVPAYAVGTRTGSLLIADNAIAGVVDPTWTEVHVEVNLSNKDGYGGPATLKDGLFIFNSGMTTLGANIAIRPTENGTAVPLPRPAVPYRTVNNSKFPPGDRTSEQGKLLGQCLAKAGTEGPRVRDIDSWEPGAMLEANGERLIMATNPGGTGACYQQTHRTQFHPYIALTLPTDQPELLVVAASVGGHPLVNGLLPVGATEIRLTLADRRVINVVSVNNTFATLLPPNAGPAHTITCQVLGPDNKVLYSGPLAN